MPGPASVEEMGAKVDYQVAAPAETGTPNLHRAKIAHKRVRMEGWRQRRLGAKTRNSQGGRRKIDLTLTGLLMEGMWPRILARLPITLFLDNFSVAVQNLVCGASEIPQRHRFTFGQSCATVPNFEPL